MRQEESSPASHDGIEKISTGNLRWILAKLIDPTWHRAHDLVTTGILGFPPLIWKLSEIAKRVEQEAVALVESALHQWNELVQMLVSPLAYRDWLIFKV